MKNLFLFGAGASYGSNDVNPYSPPLGNDLFHKLNEFEPHHWGRFPSEIVDLFNLNFERGMGEIWDKYSTHTADLMQSLGRYFSNFTVGSENLYYRLISSLKKTGKDKECLFSTINYDCLIEDASIKNGYKIDYNPKFNQNSQAISILKLHGSCNFITAQLNASNIRFSKGIVFEGGIKPIPFPSVRSYFSGNTSLPPVMSIYARNKPLQVSPNTIKQIQNVWQDYIQTVEQIFVIGLNPNIEDSHIWDFLTKTQAKIFYIGNEVDFDQYTQNHRDSKENLFINTTFETSFMDLLKILI